MFNAHLTKNFQSPTFLFCLSLPNWIDSGLRSMNNESSSLHHEREMTQVSFPYKWGEIVGNLSNGSNGKEKEKFQC